MRGVEEDEDEEAEAAERREKKLINKSPRHMYTSGYRSHPKMMNEKKKREIRQSYLLNKLCRFFFLFS